MFYRIAADVVLATHASFVLFVVVGFVLIPIGAVRRWSWVRNRWFRLTHLAAIGVVVLQAWLGIICPLTTLEMELRSRSGDAVYTGSFIAHWVERLLFYDAPAWVFVVCYTIFGILVVSSWILVRPRPFKGRR